MEKKYEMPKDTFSKLCREFDDKISLVINDFLEKVKKDHKDRDSIAQSIALPLMMRGANTMRLTGMSERCLIINFVGLFLHNKKLLENEIKQKPHEFLIQVSVEYLLELGFTREDIVEHVCKIHEEYIND